MLTKLTQWRAQAGNLTTYFALLNAIYLVWTGLLKFPAPASWVGLLAGALLLCYRREAMLRWGAVLASLIYGFNLTHMLTQPVWVESLGGFPFIGAGQGIIKFVPMLATSLYLLSQGMHAREQLEKIAVHTARIGILLVMGWIGSMKFFLFEAEGIEPLLRNHWIFGWMYGYWSVQGVSNIIGTVELLFALCLLWRPLIPVAFLGIAVTVACTTSFMFTLPGWAPDAYFPLLNRSGIFLLKDQFLLAAMVLLASYQPQKGQQ